MNLKESFRIALRALNANKVRSLLTMLGVIIGVAAVILLVAIGTGVQDEVTGSIEGLGSNLIFAFPGNVEQGGGGGGGPGGSIQKQFSLDDAEMLQRRLGPDDKVVPVIQAAAIAKVGNREWRTTMAAGNEYSGEVFSADYASGRGYYRSEVSASSRVVIIGASVQKELFPNKDPLGEYMDVNGQRFRVIGTLVEQGGSLTGDQDNQIYLPITTAQRLLGTRDISIIIVKAADATQIDLIQQRIKRALKPRFGEEFSVFTQQETLGILSQLLGTLTVMLAGIAGISLLVGGIGIMNIMLVSVSERTREIGIRKAVGAKTYDIMSQFVIEAIVLSVAGGVIGITIGWLGSEALKVVVPTQVTPWAVALAFLFSAGVGVFFGVYPAYRASRLDPIEALRYE
ncbi:MAG: ABC transporter permease [Actinobacteria bacterium]|nr:ABC transporter permease [Actinomycetota bacterium]MCG2807593.1 ABC transporter permease [Coriobacteriia bacterium]MDP2232785.1 ABC transporter permease [Actinomycetota bacterium]